MGTLSTGLREKCHLSLAEVNGWLGYSLVGEGTVQILRLSWVNGLSVISDYLNHILKFLASAL